MQPGGKPGSVCEETMQLPYLALTSVMLIRDEG